jgi:hypothetical protein
LLRHHHCSHFAAAYGLQPAPRATAPSTHQLQAFCNVVHFPDVSPCVQPQAPRTRSARNCGKTYARGIWQTSISARIRFHHVGSAKECRQLRRRRAARVAQPWCPRLKISRGAPGSAYIGSRGTRGDRRSISRSEEASWVTCC